MEILFWVSVFVIAYVYVGLPGAARRLGAARGPAGRARRPFAAGSWPSISIVLAARNEAARLPGAHRQPARPALSRAAARSSSSPTARPTTPRAALAGPFSAAPSGSSRCPPAASRWRSTPGSPRRPASILVFADARQRFRAGALTALAANFADPAGRRRHRRAGPRLRVRRHRPRPIGDGVGAYWKYEKWLRRHESLVWSTLGATGAIYALRRRSGTRCPPTRCSTTCWRRCARC